MPAPRPLPPQLAHRPFAVSEAARLNVPSKRLRAADLKKPFHGVRSPFAVTTVDEAARAFLPRLAPDEAFSHATAALLWQLPLPPRLQNDLAVHVMTLGTNRARRGAGVRGHRSRRDFDRRIHRGLPLTGPVRTWIDLGSMLGLDDLIVAGDRLLDPRDPLATLEEIANAIAGSCASPGTAKSRVAYAELRVGSWSPGETRLRLLLLRNGLPEPELNTKVFGPDGTYLGRGDLVYRRQKVVVEYEGDQHRTDPLVFQQDIQRRERFEDADWRVVRVTKRDLSEGASVLVSRMTRLLRTRAHA